jgi:hypothetical protein
MKVRRKSGREELWYLYDTQNYYFEVYTQSRPRVIRILWVLYRSVRYLFTIKAVIAPRYNRTRGLYDVTTFVLMIDWYVSG